jgi:hypothetical protein
MGTVAGETVEDHALQYGHEVGGGSLRICGDADRELTVCARAALGDLVEGVRGVPDISRLRSRFCELSQSATVPVG